MKAVLIVSHGDFSKGLKMSVEMIAGERDDVFSLGLYPTEGPDQFEEKLETLISQLTDYDEIFVFTDLLGGSPGNTSFMKLAVDPRFHIVSGVNFPMLLTTILTDGITVEEVINAGNEGIVDLRSMLDDDMEEDE